MTFKSQILGSLCLLSGLSLAGCSGQSFDLPPAQNDYGELATYNNKVDILIMVDNSSSMLQYQNKFSAQIPEMMARLNSLGLDYHIGVTSSDMRSSGSGGQLIGNPRFVTNATPNATGLLQNMIMVGETGSDLERGLSSVFNLLQPSYLDGEGRGFLRDDALLSLVFLTNEDDYSTDPVANYQAFLDRLRPPNQAAQRGWIANFIGVVSIDGDCRTTPDFKEAGLRYMSLVAASGGVNASICRSTLAEGIRNINRRIEQIMTDFLLGRKPIVESIRVYKNGIEIPRSSDNGWDYIESDNLIRFYGDALPGATDRVTIDFRPAEAT